MKNLEKDIKELLRLRSEISVLQTVHLYCIDANDKRNFNPVKAEKIKAKIDALQNTYQSIYSKWFDN